MLRLLLNEVKLIALLLKLYCLCLLCPLLFIFFIAAIHLMAECGLCLTKKGRMMLQYAKKRYAWKKIQTNTSNRAFWNPVFRKFATPAFCAFFFRTFCVIQIFFFSLFSSLPLSLLLNFEYNKLQFISVYSFQNKRNNKTLLLLFTFSNNDKSL